MNRSQSPPGIGIRSEEVKARPSTITTGPDDYEKSGTHTHAETRQIHKIPTKHRSLFGRTPDHDRGLSIPGSVDNSDARGPRMRAERKSDHLNISDASRKPRRSVSPSAFRLPQSPWFTDSRSSDSSRTPFGSTPFSFVFDSHDPFSSQLYSNLREKDDIEAHGVPAREADNHGSMAGAGIVEESMNASLKNQEADGRRNSHPAIFSWESDHVQPKTGGANLSRQEEVTFTETESKPPAGITEFRFSLKEAERLPLPTTGDTSPTSRENQATAHRDIWMPNTASQEEAHACSCRCHQQPAEATGNYADISDKTSSPRSAVSLSPHPTNDVPFTIGRYPNPYREKDLKEAMKQNPQLDPELFPLEIIWRWQHTKRRLEIPVGFYHIATTLAKTLTTINDHKEGYIYAFKVDKGQGPDFVKIGWTTDLWKRIQDHEECYGECRIIYPPEESRGSSHERKIPHCRRVEHLIHAELVPYALLLKNCPRQAMRDHRMHGEWFDVAEDKAIRVIRRWCDWMSNGPRYEKTGATKTTKKQTKSPSKSPSPSPSRSRKNKSRVTQQLDTPTLGLKPPSREVISVDISETETPGRSDSEVRTEPVWQLKPLSWHDWIAICCGPDIEEVMHGLSDVRKLESDLRLLTLT